MNSSAVLKEPGSAGEAPSERFADEVRAGILQGLYSGRFVPGQKLIAADLVEAFGLPRSYVRDALLRLESEGIVQTTPFRGAYIRVFSREEARDIDLTIAALMALAARQAAERIGEGDNRAKLKQALEDLEVFNSPGGHYAYATARERFHRLIIAISGNEQIGRICPITQGHMVRMQYGPGYTETEHRTRLACFQAMFDAISSGDPTAAERSVRDSADDLSNLSDRRVAEAETKARSARLRRRPGP